MENTTHITCPICNKRLKSISFKHLKSHDLSIKEFRKIYPDSPIHSKESLEKKKKLDGIYRKKNKNKLDNYFINYRKSNKDKRNNYQKNYKLNNPNKVKETNKNYCKNNKFKKQNYDKLYREINAEKIISNRERYKKTESYKILKRKNAKKYYHEKKYINAWRQILYSSLKRMNKKKEKSTIELLGYNPEQLKKRIECQFTPGMSWENYGEWHIDHKKPISKFNKNTTAKIVNSLCNLQPLWATTREIDGKIYFGNLNKNKFL